MNSFTATAAPAAARSSAAPAAIIALDVASAAEAHRLLDRLPHAEWVKVGLQLYTAAGPDAVRELRERGLRVFLDLKLLDIPNTVAGAVASAAELGAELLTVHASGGRGMMEAAAKSAAGGDLRLLAVTVLTSFSAQQLEEAWGREDVDVEGEVVRLARVAADAGVGGVVASVHEAAAIRRQSGGRLRVLCPGIRLPGDAANDQVRVATPAAAVAAGADYLVIGRTVTAAASPSEAFDQVLAQIDAAWAMREGRFS